MYCKQSAHRSLLQTTVLALSLGTIATPAAAVTTGSWNGYRWARRGTLALKTVDRTSSAWTKYLSPGMKGWSAASQLDMIGSRGTVNSTCGAIFATIQVCSGKYGSSGWLGYTNVWTSSGFIVQATVKLNDSYFSQVKYSTSAWRSSVLCHELGHTIGLSHNNAIRGDTNTGSCMDYSNDPDGGGFYGKSNLTPGYMDFAGLGVIYKSLDKTQLPGTKLTLATHGFYLPGFGDHADSHGVVPEPASWAMMIAGFGLTGMVARRRRSRRPALNDEKELKRC